MDQEQMNTSEPEEEVEQGVEADYDEEFADESEMQVDADEIIEEEAVEPVDEIIDEAEIEPVDEIIEEEAVESVEEIIEEEAVEPVEEIVEEFVFDDIPADEIIDEPPEPEVDMIEEPVIEELPPEPSPVESAEPVVEARPIRPKDLLRMVVTSKEVRKKYDLKKKQLKKALKKGRIPARESGDVWLMRRDDAAALWGKKAKKKAQVDLRADHNVLDAVITLKEARKLYGVKKKVAKKAIKDGHVIARKARKSYLIERDSASQLWG